MSKLEPLTYEMIQAQVETIRQMAVDQRKCRSNSHTAGFCGEKCWTLTSDTFTSIDVAGSLVTVNVIHKPTGIRHSHSTAEMSTTMAEYMCLEKIADELKYLENKYDRD